MPSDTYYHISNRRGRVRLSEHMLASDERSVRALYAEPGFRIWRAEFLIAYHVIEYACTCDKFRPIKPGDEMPIYQVVLFNEEGGIRVAFEEL